MAKTIELYSVFVSSTSEMREERELFSEVVALLNKQRGVREGFQLRILMWEHDVTPDAGITPQDHINSEIGQDYEIFVGILCSRFGTATEKYGSGTEEEFNLALQRREENGSLPRIIFYFRDPRSAVQEIDAEQLVKVDKFKKSIAGKSIYKTYNSVQEFRTYLFDHLDSAIDKIKSNTDKVKSSSAPLDHGQELPDESTLSSEIDDLGIMDLEDIAVDRFTEFTLLMQRLTASQEILSAEMSAAADETRKLKPIPGQSPDRKTAKRILSRVASHMDAYTKEINSASLQLGKLFTEAISATQSAIVISTEDGTANASDIESLYGQIKVTRGIMHSLKGHITSFKESVQSMPRMLQVFNRSKRDLTASLDDLIKFCEASVRQIDSVIDKGSDSTGN